MTTQTLTAQQIVQNILLGAGVTATNISYTGYNNAKGSFTVTGTNNLGFSKGFVMTTGTVLQTDPLGSNAGPSGPNNATGAGLDNNEPGDAYLTTVAGAATHNRAILEFDFVPQSDTVKFRYVFGSDEYMEYVSGGFADVFAFVLSGVSTPMPATNIALIPGTTTPVTALNVNANTNSAYYVDNTGGAVCQYDGFTTVLTAKSAVVCGETYHIKIMIADALDGAVDSGVFLEAGSFSSAPPITVSSSNSNVAFADTLMYEGCNTNCLYLVRTGNTSVKDSFQLSVTGNAVNGVDYQVGGSAVAWPTKLVYNANQDTIYFCNLKAVEDNTPEGLDTIKFTISTFTTSALACASNTIKFNLYIKDYIKIAIGQGDSSICNGQSINLNAAASNGVPAYTYTWQPGGSNASTINTGPVTQPTNYTITVKDICNDRQPETKVITVTPTTLPYMDAIADTKFCLDSIKKIQVVPHNGSQPYTITWIVPSGGVAPFDVNGFTYSFMTSGTPTQGTYTVALVDQCNKKDTVTAFINIVDCTVKVPNVVTPNGDNVNETFKIHGLENFPGSALYVYNRWGNKIYQNNSYNNDWKPDSNCGTYFYVLELTDGRKFNGFFEVFKN
ncbi:MAG: gliding motility-associated C-terminal domain-containing protein [Bacteroidetes bacterium]|nr:gliding motility-associated C-terminal domain-containing protein [Bacteroidota bacterium]